MADSISSSQSSSKRPLGDALLELEPLPHYPKDPLARRLGVGGGLTNGVPEFMKPAAQPEAEDTSLTPRPRPPLLGRTSIEARDTPFLTTNKQIATRWPSPGVSTHGASQTFKKPVTCKSCAQRRRPGLGL